MLPTTDFANNILTEIGTEMRLNLTDNSLDLDLYSGTVTCVTFDFTSP